MVTSTSQGEGKTTTALALAINSAQTGRPVLLIDGDMRHPTVHKALGIDNSRGLSNYLSSDVPPLGVVRTIADSDNDQAEYAILVRSDLKGQRLGWKLLDKMVHYCRSRGTKEIVGQVLRDNSKMLDLVLGMGFTSHGRADEDVVEVSLKL